jgi:hypothetical protein
MKRCSIRKLWMLAKCSAVPVKKVSFVLPSPASHASAFPRQSRGDLEEVKGGRKGTGN